MKKTSTENLLHLNKYPIFTFGKKKSNTLFRLLNVKIILALCLQLTLVGVAAGQNTSYNANTVPIGGNFSTAFGAGSLLANAGNGNSATGYQALNSNTSGIFNTANGYKALSTNTTGNFNTANGSFALSSITTGGENTANGANALFSNTTGIRNTANGYYALSSNTTGNFNSANGSNTLYFNSTGENNTANGYGALFSNLAGDGNTALGGHAGHSTLGSGNLFLGYQAGYNETGNDKLYIGNDSDKIQIYGDFSGAKARILLGNTNPTGYVFKGDFTLNVIGGILTDSVRVAHVSDWADHVFEPDYQLKTFDELNNYIKTNKHLPNIPSAGEVAKKGIDVAAMDSKLLEKIEELHLYILQLEERLRNIELKTGVH